MAVFQEKCWPCGKQCINAEFCGIDETYQLPRNIKVKVIANSEFWGFGGTVIEGYAHFDNSHYDFFDGFDQHHKELDCNGNGPYRYESRPDINYRSVYDPDSATVVHYGAGGLQDDIDRGGAEVYLVDRVSQNATDSPACTTTDPTKVFKWFPEKFGFGTKIHFHNNIYKNITGGWRLIDPTGCYTESFTTPPGSGGYLHQCTGVDKQNIRIREHSEGTYLQYHEPSRIRPIQSGMTFHDCFADGQIAPEYGGQLTQLLRHTGVAESGFIIATLNYGGAAASGLRNSMEILLTNDVDTTYNKAYRIFDVIHSGSSTDVSLVGTYDTGNAVNVNTTSSGNWIALGTHDPLMCCGGVAYGIDNDLKTSITTNYHTDFRRVFNDAKNLRQSNRVLENRKNHDIDVVFRGTDDGRTSFSRSSNRGFGDDHLPSFRPDKTYPSIDENGNPLLFSAARPVFDRDLPYYGPFHHVDQHDGATRFDQVKNVIKSRNATCYSKKAILEVFPDCLTQYEEFLNCDVQKEYKINRLPRLAFVYRGCNYDEFCSFDESGRPLGDSATYGGWTTSGPATLEDIKRGLPGQEITMFINVADAWGGEYKRCPCSCDGSVPGNRPPEHTLIESPITFPCFPDFDKYPVANGCKEKRFQFFQYAKYVEKVPGSDLAHEHCDELPGVDAACNVRQPYTTYGHISHLCGWESGNAKTTLTNAFAKERQDGTYTQRTPESGNINEPMYWAFQCPSPTESGVPVNRGVWASGTVGDNKITNVSGEFYPYWGLTDVEGRLTTPYYNVTTAPNLGCCGSPITFLDYDDVYTFFNGWPTSAVPFLIELETVDNCVGCATTVMETGSLELDFQGLAAAYLHDVPTNIGTDAYGFHHCKYRGTKLEPGFNCESGFPENFCPAGSQLFPDDGFYIKHGQLEVENTCKCISAQPTLTLSPIIIEDSTDIIIGWSTNGFVELRTCNSTTSNFLETDTENLPGAGFTTYGKFSVACEENIDFVDPPTFPNAYYEGASTIHNLYSCGGCTHKEPAQIAGQGNLTLKSEFFVVSNLHKHVFEALPDDYFDRLELLGDLEDDFIPWPEFSGVGQNLILCSGDKILRYGCLLGSEFYGCGSAHTACAGNTLCNTCDDFGVSCACNSGIFIEYTDPDTDFVTRRYPPQFDWAQSPGLNSCFCECKDPTLMAIYEVSGDYPGNNFIEEWRHAGACDNSIANFAPWFAISGVGGTVSDPIWIGEGPPAPYLGQGFNPTYSEDWFSFSHGENRSARGISYRLDEPVADNCGNLDPDSCASGFCIDKRARSATCLDPIAYATGAPAEWAYGDANVTVNKRYCSPEIMVVSKIECVPGNSGYDLTVSREYHEHDRTWRQAGSTDCACVEKYAGAYKCPTFVPVSSGTGASGQFTVDVGGTGHFTVTSAGQDYVFGGTAVIPTCVNGTTTRPCCTGTPTPAFTATFGGANNSLTGASISPPTGYSPTGLVCDVSIIAGTGPSVLGTGCTVIPYAVPTDSVTPAYQAPCSINPSSGTFVNQDFRIQSTCESGDPVWNYYNLFYSGDSVGVPPVVGAANTYESGYYYGGIFIQTDPDAPGGCGPQCDIIIDAPDLDPGYPHTIFDQALFNTPPGRFGIDATNRKHSCIQDITKCGGQLWCNKLFFPRRSYNKNTKVAPFGSSQICTQNAEFLNRTTLGYGNIPNADILKESTFYRYIDLCDADIIASTQLEVGIDDVVIRVDDYLRLMGVVHPGWRYNLDMKSCTIVETGDCGGTLPPTHSDMTIHSAVHQPKTWTTDGWESFGYYLDKDGVSDSGGNNIGASGSDNCLFDPFKIMVDVECSTNHIKRRGIETDDPTLLDAIIDMPAAACLGTIGPPPCSCVDSNCKFWNGHPNQHCFKYFAINDIFTKIDDALICPCDPNSLTNDILIHECEGEHCTTGVHICSSAAAGSSPAIFPAFSQWIQGKYVLGNSGDALDNIPLNINPFTPILEFTGIAANVSGVNYTYTGLYDAGLLRKACGWEDEITCEDSVSGGGGEDSTTHSGHYSCAGTDNWANVFVWCDDPDIIVGRTAPTSDDTDESQITGFQLPTWQCSGDFGVRWLANSARIPGDPSGCCDIINDNEGLCETDIYVLGYDADGNPLMDCNSDLADDNPGGMVVLSNWSGIPGHSDQSDTTWASGCGCDSIIQNADVECGTDSKVRITITQDPIYDEIVKPDPPLSPSDVLAIVFIDEAQPDYSVGSAGEAAFSTDIIAWENHMDTTGLDSSILVLQPIGPIGPLNLIPDYTDLVPPSRKSQPPNTGKAFPDFVQYGEISRDAACTLEQIKAHFLAAAHTTVPRALGIFIDISGSMTRATIEPCVDDFIAWYKEWSAEQTGTEGCVKEVQTTSERWISEALAALIQADSECP